MRFVLIWLWCMNTIDAFLTLKMVSIGGVMMEGNPLMRVALSLSPSFFMIVKIWMATLSLLFLYSIPEKSHPILKMAVCFISVAYTTIVLIDSAVVLSLV